MNIEHMIEEDLGNGMVRLTAEEGYELYLKATCVVFSEAIVKAESKWRFDVRPIAL